MNAMPEEFLQDVYDLFSAYLSLDELRTIIEAATYEALQKALNGATKESVLEAAKDRAAKLVTGISDQMREQLAKVISKGLEEQMGVEGTARLIREVVPLDKQRAAQLEKYRQSLIADGVSGVELEKKVKAYSDQLVRDRARVISQTEMGRALEEGAFEEAKRRGATHKVWLTVSADTVCDECAAAQAEGPIPINQDFGHGAAVPPAHPRCRCTLSYLTDTGKGELGRAKERAAERTARLARLEEGTEQ